LDNFGSLIVDFKYSPLHIDICVDILFAVLDYKLELVDIIDWLTILVLYSLRLNDIKALINKKDVGGAIRNKHMRIITGEAPAIPFPPQHLLNLKRLPINLIDLILSPGKNVYFVGFFEVC
jgi:hypothetical protein